MNADVEATLRAGAPAEGNLAVHPGWRTALPLVFAAIVAILAIYRETATAIVGIWWRSETFAHGFVIVPIVLVLVWLRRGTVAPIAPKPDWVGFALLAIAGAMWLVASAGRVAVVEQFAVVAMIPAAVIAVCGRHVAWALAFPLVFLFFGVPVGEGLIPPLMEWTADFTVAALRLTGIPVHREGLFFAIPSGNWSVVEGCSGVRYLIASITVGALFAYLNYRSLKRRMLFMLASILVPILANGARAYIIVMIGHLSDGKLAHGVDHFIYGWVFFGLVMLLLFWVGSFWREDAVEAPPSQVEADAAADHRGAGPGPAWGVAGSAVAAVAIAALWALYADRLEAANATTVTPTLAVPAATSGWIAVGEPLTDWRPRYGGTAASVTQVYRKGDHAVMLWLGYYRNQRDGAELLASTNIMVVQKHKVWSNVGASTRVEDIGRGKTELRETHLRSASQRLLVWDWFRLAGRDLISTHLGQLLLARDRLLGRGDAAAAIIVATPYDEAADDARDTLRAFVREMLPSINAALGQVSVDAVAD